jgi:hypothetical protein
VFLVWRVLLKRAKDKQLKKVIAKDRQNAEKNAPMNMYIVVRVTR